MIKSVPSFGSLNQLKYWLAVSAQHYSRNYMQFKLDCFTSDLQQFGTVMLFVLKKMAIQSVVVTRNCRKFNYRFFAFMSDTKNFSKSTKIDEKVPQSQQPPQSQQTTGLEENQSTENTMVGANHNGQTDKEVPKPNTDSNGKTPQEHSKPNTKSNFNQNSNQDPKKPINPQNLNKPPKIDTSQNSQNLITLQNPDKPNQQSIIQGQVQKIKLINLKNSDKFDFKKWITKEWVKTVGFTTLIAIIIGMYQIKLQIEALKEDKERFQKGEETKKEQFQKQMMQKYCSIEVREDYVDSPLQEQVRNCLNLVLKERVKLIAGCPGIGKTTVIKKVLSDMKKEGAEVFYFSFGDQKKKEESKKQIAIKLQQFYGLMGGILKQFASQKKYAGKKVKVVLDDINKLEDEPQTFIKVMKDIYLEIECDQIDINCISTSGSFIDNQLNHQRWKSYRAKYGKVLILQHHQNPEKIREFQIKVLRNKHGQKIKNMIKDGQDNLLIEAIVDIGLVTRELEEFTELFLDFIQIKQKITIQEAKRLLKGYENGQIQKLATKVSVCLTQIQDNNQEKRFLSHFLSSEEKLSFQKCSDITIHQKSKTVIRFQKAFRQLEKKNIIIFCRPRARYQEKVFRTLMKKYQQSSQPTVK